MTGLFFRLLTKVPRKALVIHGSLLYFGMMLKKPEFQEQELELVSIESLVPGTHLLRKIDSAVDFGFIHERVKHLYREDNVLNSGLRVERPAASSSWIAQLAPGTCQAIETESLRITWTCSVSFAGGLNSQRGGQRFDPVKPKEFFCLYRVSIAVCVASMSSWHVYSLFSAPGVVAVAAIL